MKKELKNKLIFISGVVFALALLFVSVQLIRAAQTNTWSAPTQPFPQANVYTPIDIGPGEQTKDGSLILKGDNKLGATIQIQANQSFAVENSPDAGYFMPSLSSGLGAVINSSKSLLINTKGLVLPRTGTGAPIDSPLEGTIYYNTTKKGVKLYDGSNWVDIGSGGGGESVWTKVESGAFFDGNAALGTMADQGGYEPTGKVFTVDSKTLNSLYKNSFSFLNKAEAAIDYEGNRLLECDKSDVQEECFGFVVVSGHHAVGDLKYDRYMDYGEPGIKPGPTKVSYKELEYKIKPAIINSTGVLYAKDINISQPSWGETQEVAHTGGSDPDIPGNNYKSGWTYCPNGYFVSGFRLGHDPDGLTFVLKCSKL